MRGYAWSVVATAAATVAGLLLRPYIDPVNVAMLYLLAVVIVALRFSRGASAATAVLCVLVFDFVFVPPYLSFAVNDAQYLVTFSIMLAVGLVISGLSEAARREARARAAAALDAETERLRGALLSSISHDLRTPLAVMSGASSSLVESGGRLGEDERRALAQSIFEQSRAMADVMGNVLQMTRLETGAIVLKRDWAALGELAGSALDRLGDALARHRVMLELPPDLPLVRVDAVLMEQVLGNLLGNAAKHTPAGTLVRVRAARKDEALTVTIEDFGSGLPPEAFERVFAKFQRGKVEGGGGIGLGLAICRAIVTLHGGRIWAEQLPGGGTAFRFTLPLEPAPPAPAEEP
jgi:two-component system, OmpR family, sensor histidine kinase KdpD